MLGDLFDSPWKILIVALVVIVLFGSKKLPSAARSLGQSMRILKKEVHGLHEDEPESRPAGAQAPAETAVSASGEQSARQVQIDALQHQISDLQRVAAADAGAQTAAATAAAADQTSLPVRQPS
jgi:sec-independent protein translocase protein TatA